MLCQSSEARSFLMLCWEMCHCLSCYCYISSAGYEDSPLCYLSAAGINTLLWNADIRWEIWFVSLPLNNYRILRVIHRSPLPAVQSNTSHLPAVLLSITLWVQNRCWRQMLSCILAWWELCWDQWRLVRDTEKGLIHVHTEGIVLILGVELRLEQVLLL